MTKLVTFFVALWLAATVSQAQQTFESDVETFKVDVIAEGLNHPWGMAMLPDGRLVVTERAGFLKIVNPNNGKISKPVRGMPKIAVGGQGGLLDVALDPDFSTNGILYFTFSKPGRGGAGTAVGSGRLDLSSAPTLREYKELFVMNEKTRRGQHFGSRVVVARDGALLVTIGDRGNRPDAQNKKHHAGSVIRIAKDGSVPADNPWASGKDALPELWSIGHRNPQGATLHPETGELWTVEHGARGGDEINKPEAGKNYGWPIISYGRHYSGAKIGVGRRKPGMEQPQYYWDPSIAPSGMAFYTGTLFPKWKDNLFIGALRDQMLVRLILRDGKIVNEEHLLKGEFGRIRDVRSFSDGALWLLTDSDDGQVLRLSKP